MIDLKDVAVVLSITVSLTVLIGFFLTLSKLRRDRAKDKKEESDKVESKAREEGRKDEKDAQLRRDVDRAFVKIGRVEIVQSKLVLLVKQNQATNATLIEQEKTNAKELRALSKEMGDIKLSIAKIAGKLGIEEGD